MRAPDDSGAEAAATGGEQRTGYAHAGYAESLAEFGTPRHLTRSDGWLLERPIGDLAHRDGMGPYPLFFCRDWERLPEDLSALASDLVSVVLVTDPFADVEIGSLDRCFDRVARFKDHYVIELDRKPESFVSASHRARARRALRQVDVDVCDRPWEQLPDWQRLFADLMRRHSITGIRAFSPQAFDMQLRIPGLVMFRASVATEVVGLDLWYVQGDVAYGHLAAFSDLGYESGASYATKWTMLQHFSSTLQWADLSGTAGAGPATNDGLAQFKAGWSSGTRPVYLCGRVLKPDVYEELTNRRGERATSYFPAYRRGEFV